MALDDHRAPPRPTGRLPEKSEASPRGQNPPREEAGDAGTAGAHAAACPDDRDSVADPATDTATRLLRNRKPPSTQRLIDRVTTVVRDEAWLGPWLPLGDRTGTLRITEQAASVALRHAADAVPGVTAASCRLARADQAAGMHVRMTVTAGLDRPLPETAGLVRRSVVDASGQALGIAVTAVDITVIDAYRTGA
ncbi:Asp23/Gls24 family envelope stress response protein [Streptomyces sp. NPDC057950]|uniref:Asp23/Gls24 family envelope stress response protein n=1 Tax=Streptomyces sp. NPDC057950 TaxID=3346288 RepID=UPI0036EB77E6